MEVLALLDEERLRYAGSIVLGLNDALVEFTGSLAGFTFALQDTRIIAAVGFITGIAASLSMASSEYLSQKSDRTREDPLRAAFYTGIAYIITVILLVSPFLLVPQPFAALMVTLGAALATSLS
jgi:VIT1/CCC1 family predicted Fe2+/Mn2+ transporter